jgi:hypothetical protein
LGLTVESNGSRTTLFPILQANPSFNGIVPTFIKSYVFSGAKATSSIKSNLSVTTLINLAIFKL